MKQKPFHMRNLHYLSDLSTLVTMGMRSFFSLEPAVPTAALFKHFYNYRVSLFILLENYSKKVCTYPVLFSRQTGGERHAIDI